MRGRDIDVSEGLADDTKIISDFGEVNVRTELEKKDYTFEIKLDLGSVKIDNEKEGSTISRTFGRKPYENKHECWRHRS